MRFTSVWRTTTMVAALAVLGATPAAAQTASERTTIRIDEAVMVPGATLEPGTYVFELADPTSTQHVVQIRKEAGDHVTTAMTVPMKRQDTRGDVVLKINPTESGTPALKGWFYPGSVYGHQFVYPDEQAKQIAERTRTIVLSQDVKGSDMQQGRIYVYDPMGQRTPYTEDQNLRREWNEWRQSQGQAAQGQQQQGQQQQTRQAAEPTARAVVKSPQGEKRESTAPMIAAGAQGTRVELDDLEDNAQQYTGKTISVDAEVDEVLGPRVFKIDEGHWFNLGGEMLVVMPTHLAALVNEDDRVTVTGTVKEFVRAEFEREWGFLGLTDEIEVELRTRPVLVASRVVGGDDNVALMIQTGQPDARTTGQTGQQQAQQGRQTGDRPVGTAGEKMDERFNTGRTVTNLSDLADADHEFVGRDVKIENVRIEKTAKDGGFWARSGNTSILVLPVDTARQRTAGQSVSVDGVVLRMPRHMRESLDPGADWNDTIYIYATELEQK